MEHEILILTLTAAGIGFVHTILGPDHYLPFIMIGRARKWSQARIVSVTALCGLGHVLSSVVLGGLGIGLGLAVTQLEALEAARGNIAAWALVGFGATYFAWGLRHAAKNRPHTHWHQHSEGVVHNHEHKHQGTHAHPHEARNGASLTPWILFTIFVFGPCEALIPLVMYPAAKSSAMGVLLVTSVFGLTTLATMVGTVILLLWGANRVSIRGAERYAHAAAGAVICISGLAIQALGL